MHGDAFQLALVRCNWGRISNPRLHAAQVNALDTFLFAQKCPFDKNVTKCKSAEGSWDKYNWQNYIHISFYKSVQQTNFQKKRIKRKMGRAMNIKLLMQLYITRVLWDKEIFLCFLAWLGPGIQFQIKIVALLRKPGISEGESESLFLRLRLEGG